ncbi:TPA: DUF1266 domain-containing protein [Escherichia coli]|nr:DUF1266 domain-containing protein [Escherichia coli]EGE6515495.1 DUF1266 domain-containing protein [Escherichia coli]EGO7707825.1 DUF1266 domain-containing protein [Escherichia coli]EGP6194963.1 DUF1266 domain-containing protein [Escherichia coli]EGW0096849.1 DUF1266 domain-containing protein [Escherichia coli]
MERTLPWKPLLCLLFLLSTGCDRAEKQKIAAQLQQDKEAISSVVKKSYRALCGPEFVTSTDSHDRLAEMQQVFTPALMEPVLKYWQESPKTCKRRFPSYSDPLATFVAGDKAQIGAFLGHQSYIDIPMELIREGDGKWKIAAIDFASLHEFEKNGRVTDEVQKKIDLLKKRSFKQHRDFPLLTRTAPERVSNSPLTSVEQTVTEPDSSWLDVLLTIGKYALYLVAIILILALVAVLWIGYGLVFAGHRLFKASCKDPSIQKIPAAERWAMAVGAPYAIAGNNHWARRVVNDDSVEAENDCKSEVESLADMWGVFDRDSLLEQLLALFVAGHRSVYAEQIKNDSEMPDAEYRAFAQQLAQNAKSSSEAKERLWQLQMVRKNRRKICDIDFCAWDMVRFVMLCNSGAQVGYITQREMVDFSMLAARRVQQHYRSWRELAGHFLLARWYWKATDKRHLITHILFKKAITSLLKEQGSPWRTLPWDTPLPEGTETAFAWACGVSTADVVEVQPDTPDKAIYEAN